MRSLLRVLAFTITATCTLVPVTACKTTSGSGFTSKIVDCASQAVRDKGLVYLGKVNDVLGNLNISDPEARVRLINLGVDVGQDVLGCVLADQGLKFAEATAANPGDRVSQTAARRAKTRLDELEADGWRFNQGPAPSN